jgi:hypothetical protein
VDKSNDQLCNEVLAELRVAAEAFVTNHEQDGTASKTRSINELAVATGESAARIADLLDRLDARGEVVESTAYPNRWTLPEDDGIRVVPGTVHLTELPPQPPTGRGSQ